MIKVAYDRAIFVQQKRGGISRYFCELISRVNRSHDFRAEVIAPLHTNEHLTEARIPVLGILQSSPLAKLVRPRRLLEETACRLLLTYFSPTIIHHTYYHPIRRYKLPTVVTVYDMIHEKFADEFGTGDQISARKRAAVERADLVICISERTRQDLIELLQVPPHKTRTVHLGSSLMAAPSASNARSRSSRQHLLYVGQRQGYKNFATLLQAYARDPEIRRSLRIVAFGGGRGFSSAETELIRRLGLDSTDLEQIDGSDATLAQLYQSAFAFVCPSLYEGFGIPPLEAMSLDCPVICSTGGSLPEVVGEAARLFDPTQPDDLTCAIRELMHSETREDLIRRGRLRTQAFTWERCANETMKLYRELVA